MRKEGLVIIYHGGGGEGGYGGFSLCHDKICLIIPPWRSVIFLCYPPTPLPLMDAILVSCRKSPFIKSGFAANFYLYRYPVILQNLSLSLVLWWMWYLWKCKWFFNWSYSAFWMSVVKPKPKQLQQPIIARKSSQEPMRTLMKNKQTARNAGKPRVIKWRVVVVWNLIGSESGACSLDQSRSELKQTQCNPGHPRHSVENYSTLYRHSHFLTNFWYPFVHSGVPGTTLGPAPV